MRFSRYDNRLRKYHGFTVYGIKQSKLFFFLVEQMFASMFIQISLIKNNQVNFIIDYILVQQLIFIINNS